MSSRISDMPIAATVRTDVTSYIPIMVDDPALAPEDRNQRIEAVTLATPGVLFTELSGQIIPDETNHLVTTGYSEAGIGEGLYHYDAAVTQEWIDAESWRSRVAVMIPSTADGDERGFMLSLRGLTPWQVGCLGGDTDDAVALQAYFTICRDNAIGYGDWGGVFKTSVPLEFGTDDLPPMTRNFRGILDLTGTGGTGANPEPYVLAIRNLSMLCAEGWRIFGKTAGNRAPARCYVVGLLLDNVPRLSVRQQWFRHFQCAGAIGLSNNNLSHYGFVKASDCGSGARSSRNSDATRFGFTDTLSNPLNYGSAGSTRQRCVLDYTTGPPSWLTDNRFGRLELLGPAIRLTHKGGIVSRRYPIASVDQITQIAQLTAASDEIQVEDSSPIDVGATATGDYIPDGTTVAEIVDSSHVRLSAAVDFEPSSSIFRGLYFTSSSGIIRRGGTMTEGSRVVVMGSSTGINVDDEVTANDYIAAGTFVESIDGLNVTLNKDHTYTTPALGSINVTFSKPGTITLGVWPDANVDYTKTGDYCIGGTVVLRGNDHNVCSFDKIDAIRCGHAGPFHSLHAPAMSGEVVGQFCGTTVALGKFNGSCYGGNLNIYAEGCIEDLILSTVPSVAGYNVLNSEKALSLARCYREAVPRNSDNSLQASSQPWSFGHFTFQGVEYDYEKAPYMGATSSASVTHSITQPGYNANHRKDVITLKFQLDPEIHRLTGYTNFVINVTGEGTNPNNAPTSVTVSVPELPTNCTLNGGIVPVLYDGFDSAAQIFGRFEIADDIVQVGSITLDSDTVDGLTTSRLSNGMYVNGVGIPSGTVITISDADTITLTKAIDGTPQLAIATNAAAVLTFSKRNLRVWKAGGDQPPEGVQTVANVGKALSLATSTRCQEWTGSNLTVDRTCALPAPRGNGRVYRIMRHTSATGSNLLVNSSAAALLLTIVADGANNWFYDFCDSGGEYRLIGKGNY